MIKKFIVGIVVLFSGVVFADEAQLKNTCTQQVVQHSGGTDKCGCHFNRKTGEYHCHNRKQRGGDCPP